LYRLYYSPGSCSLAAHVALEEIGEPFELELVPAVGEGRKTETPEYREINPKGRVPALRGVPGHSGGTEGVLTEVVAILLYLARAHPEAGLLPADAAGEARCLEWLSFLSTSVHAMSYGQIWRPGRFVGDEGDRPAVVAKGHRSVREQYAYVEGLLADGRGWAVPGGYSIADPYLLVFYLWGNLVGLKMRSLFPAWTGLTECVVGRSAVRRALEKEGLAAVLR
jgi:glutathione S-transferase